MNVAITPVINNAMITSEVNICVLNTSMPSKINEQMNEKIDTKKTWTRKIFNISTFFLKYMSWKITWIAKDTAHPNVIIYPQYKISDLSFSVYTDNLFVRNITSFTESILISFNESIQALSNIDYSTIDISINIDINYGIQNLQYVTYTSILSLNNLYKEPTIEI